MKNRTKLMLFAAINIFCLLAASPSQRIAQAGERDGGRVTSAEIHPVNKVITGHCPVKVEFTGHITTDGPAIVKYRVVQNDVGNIRSETFERTLVFRESGTHPSVTA